MSARARPLLLLVVLAGAAQAQQAGLTQTLEQVSAEAVALQAEAAALPTTWETPENVERALRGFEQLDPKVEALKQRVEALWQEVQAQRSRAETPEAVTAANTSEKLWRAAKEAVQTVRTRPRNDLEFTTRANAMSPPKSGALEDLKVANGMWRFVHRDRIRFVTRELQGGEMIKYRPSTKQRPLLKGEPVLITHGGLQAIDGVSVTSFTLADLSPRPLKESFPHPLRPAWLSVNEKGQRVGSYGTVVAKDDTGFELEDAAFMGVDATGVKGYEDFLKAREKIITCYRDEMQKLDPAGQRKNFLVKKRSGNAPIEELAVVYDRKACQRCGCARFNEQKRALAGRVVAPLQQRAFEELQPVISRVAELFSSGR
jgi:hypothetical protein